MIILDLLSTDKTLTDANIEDTWSMIKDTLNQGTSEFVPKCKIKNT